MAARAIADYHDFLSLVIVCCPDFPELDFLAPSEQLNVDRAFAELERDLPCTKARVRDEKRMAVLFEMLRMAHEAYRQGNDKRGAFILQELQGIIWPSEALPVLYENEARHRLSGAADA
jgi:hypothetical protein